MSFKMRPVGNNIQLVSHQASDVVMKVDREVLSESIHVSPPPAQEVPSTSVPSPGVNISPLRPRVSVPQQSQTPQTTISLPSSPPFDQRKTERKSFFIQEDSILDVPPGVNEIFISLVGGGGSGGIGAIDGNISFSGGGGGAGHGFRGVPVKITNNSTVSVDCQIGKGGNKYNRVGTDTIVNIIVNGSSQVTLIGGGGEPGGNGDNNHGGLGGKLNGNVNVRSKSGFKGSASIPSHPPSGGGGGASLFAIGGKGTSYHMQIHSESNGKWGSGGGGKIPTSSYEVPSSGGDGFVIVEFDAPKNENYR